MAAREIIKSQESIGVGLERLAAGWHHQVFLKTFGCVELQRFLQRSYCKLPSQSIVSICEINNLQWVKPMA
jgi:hypothetical protein